MKTLITCYENPDLDGAACAYAYAELLRAQGQDVEAAIFGSLHPEAEFVFDNLKVEIGNADAVIESADKVILVDASERRFSNPKMEEDKVTEIIDHRLVNESDQFKNAVVQVEKVGACTTLIAERFIKAGLKPSSEAAVLLYLAIVSNTINFRAKVTTERDHKMAEYLKSIADVTDKIAHDMFVYKSKLEGPIKEVLLKDLATNEIAGKSFTIFQLEIIGVDEFVKNNQVEIEQALSEIIKSDGFDYAFLTCVDLEEGKNTFVVPDAATEKFLGEALKVRFTNHVARYPEIIMRKEIMPKLKEYLESKS